MSTCRIALYRANFIRADSRFVPSQWETVLLCNNVSHWLGASLQAALLYCPSTRLLTLGIRCTQVEVGTSLKFPGNRYWMSHEHHSISNHQQLDRFFFFQQLVQINTLRLRQNGRHFPDDIFKWIFLNENVWISINISLKFVPRGPINNIPTLVQVMAWRRPGDKPLSEPMMVRLPMHICITRAQWVNKKGNLKVQHQWNPLVTYGLLHKRSIMWKMFPCHGIIPW